MKVLTLIFTILLSISSVIHQKNNNHCYTLIKADDFFLKMHQENTIVIDVRVFKNYKKSRIDGAIAIPDKKTLLDFFYSLNKNTTILVYCSDGYRSGTAADILCRELNFIHVFSLNRGLDEWINRGYDVDKTPYRKIK